MSKERLSKPVYTADSVARTKQFKEFQDIVKAFGNGAHITAPKDWIGKTVRVTLLDDEAPVKKVQK